jgi:hypothetical protein
MEMTGPRTMKTREPMRIAILDDYQHRTRSGRLKQLDDGPIQVFTEHLGNEENVAKVTI